MIWIIGGTTECRQIIDKIKGKTEYVVTTATYSGKEILKDDNTLVMRMDTEQMISFIREKDIDIVVDMTHPYAIEVTNNAKEACNTTNTIYLRFVRKKSLIKDAIYMESLEECIRFLKDIEGCTFFTTGIKNIRDFEKVRGENRFVYRVLPSLFSIQECVHNNIEMKDMIAILGPTSKELNKTMFLEYGAKYVVMKDSGKEGGTEKKIAACKELGITPIVIGRKEEEGITDIDILLERIIEQDKQII